MRRQRPVQAICIALICVIVPACAGDDRAGRGDEPIRTTIGDTTEVRIVGDGAWGGSASLVEEVSIGALEGAEEYQFGTVSDIAVDASGGIYVFDGQAPALRYYDHTGAFVRQLGAEGEGPGEYKDASLGMAVRKTDGRLVMRDPRNMRMNVYDANGAPSDSWQVASGLFTGQATVLDAFDHMYLKILTGQPEPNKPWPVALLHLDDAGVVIDTLVPPTLPSEPEAPGGAFSVSKVWTTGRDGGFLVGTNDRYVIEHHETSGRVLRIVRDIALPRVARDEKAEIEARNDWLRRTQGQFMTAEIPPVPDIKPAFRSIAVGEEGRIWVLRYMEAEEGEVIQRPARPGVEAPPASRWREPVVYDVFEADGTFLGSIRVPDRTTLSVFRGDRVWGVRRGDLDEAYVVGFRIAHN